jgi:hypothetical protein
MAYEKRGPFENGTTPAWNAVTGNHFDDALDDQDQRIVVLETFEAEAGSTFVQVANHGKPQHDDLDIDAATLQGLAASAFVQQSEKPLAGVVATVDVNTGKIHAALMPESVTGGLSFQGAWNANTNTPTIPAPASGNDGWFYKVSVEGTRSLHGQASETYAVNDTVISDGTTWVRIPSGESVGTVFGRTGAVVAASGDYNAGQITATPQGTLAGTTVAAQLTELLNEKSESSHTHSGLAPTGGTTGQVLKKLSNTNYDYSWGTDNVGAGGTITGVTAVNTIDDLRNINTDSSTSFPTGIAIMVHGYYAYNDLCPPRIYFYNRTGTSTDNGGSRIRPAVGAAATGNGRWELNESPYVFHALAWGAHPVDLATDATGGSRTTGTVGAGSNSLTVGNIRDFKKGMGIAIQGAGTAGGVHITKITAIPNSTTVTLQNAAVTAVTGARVDHAEDLVFQAILDAGSTTHSNTIIVPEGQYLFARGLTTGNPNFIWKGEGIHVKGAGPNRIPGTVIRMVTNAMTWLDYGERVGPSTTGPQFERFTFFNDAAATTRSCKALRMYNVNHFQVIRCIFRELNWGIEINSDQATTVPGGIPYGGQIVGGDASWSSIDNCGFYECNVGIQQKYSSGTHIDGGWCMAGTVPTGWFCKIEGGSQVRAFGVKLDEVSGFSIQGYGGVYDGIVAERCPITFLIDDNAQHNDNGNYNKIANSHMFVQSGFKGIEIGTGCVRNVLTGNSFSGGGAMITDNGTETQKWPTIW